MRLYRFYNLPLALLLAIHLQAIAVSCSGSKSPVESPPEPVSTPPTPVQPPSPMQPPTPEPPTEPEPPPEPQLEPPPSRTIGEWSTIGTNLATSSIKDKLRGLIRAFGESTGNVLSEVDLEVNVYLITTYFNNIKIGENSCRVSVDLSDILDNENVGGYALANCRIDNNSLYFIDESGDDGAVLNYRFNENQLVLWCNIDYYLKAFLNIDTEVLETDNQDVESLKAVFDEIDRYENTLVKSDG